jgi:hypothetical protein
MRLPTFVLMALLGAAVAANATALDDWRLTTVKPWGGLRYKTGLGTTDGMSGNQALYIGGEGNRYFNSDAPVLARRIPLDGWRGQRVRVTLRLKDEGDIRAWVRFHLSNNDSTGLNAAIQRDERGIADWQTHQFVLNVPQNAVNVSIELGLTGDGQVWLDDIALEAVGADVALSSTRRAITGPPLNDNGPILPPWIQGGDHSMDKSFAAPVRECCNSGR